MSSGLVFGSNLAAGIPTAVVIARTAFGWGRVSRARVGRRRVRRRRRHVRRRWWALGEAKGVGAHEGIDEAQGFQTPT